MSSGVEKPYVGGQAVIEGVMMRSPRCMAVAVRRSDGTIVVRDDAWISIWERLRFLRLPPFRGVVILIESLFNGMMALDFAAKQAEATEDDRGEPVVGGSNALTIALSIAIALALFVGAPHLLAWGTGEVVGKPLGVESFGFHALDGLFKLGIFVGYIAAISRIPEIRRVFEYHGAEHKVVNAYESDLELTLDNTKPLTTFHARCGTSFVLFVLVLSVLMFAVVFPFVPRVSEVAALNHVAMIFIKIPLMLPLAGIAYEINRYAATHPGQAWVQLLVVPGRLMQKLTTREPSDDQLEIALAAMRAALRHEARLESLDAVSARRLADAAPAGGTIAVFRDYAAVADALQVGL